MNWVYASIVARPERWVVGVPLVLILVAVLPTRLLDLMTVWRQSPDWARVVFQLGALIIVLVGGVIPIAKWYQDQVIKIVEGKPIVVTDRLGDGGHQIRNMSSAPAVNVWLVNPDEEGAIALGSLDAHEARLLPETFIETITSADGRHILLAAARPGLPRPYTVTFHVMATATAFRHGFDEKPRGDNSAVERFDRRLVDGRPIREYLRDYRADLVAGLNTFVRDH